jgi:hypothetical protein
MKDNFIIDQIPGEAGERLRSLLRQRAFSFFAQQVQLASARSREAVVTEARQALRCGCLLLQVPASDLPVLLRAACISQETAEAYMLLARKCTKDQRRRLLRRRGRITEDEALDLLRGTQTGDLVTILHLAD